jgi:hypothetical protein
LPITKEKKMKNWKIAIPMIALLVLPWTHKLLVINLQAAWPETPLDAAHFLIIGGSLVVAIITTLIATHP